MSVWLDGKVVQHQEARVSPLAHTLHYGMGAFEGIRAYVATQGPVVFRLEDHLIRLERSARILGMCLAWNIDELVNAVLETLRSNELQEAYIRPLIYYGQGSMSLDSRTNAVHVLIAAWPWDSYHGVATDAGLAVKISSYRRIPNNCLPVQAKAVGNYLNSQLAYREALSCGSQEAILLDDRGFIAEGSAENVFLVRDGRLLTPTTHNALEGITRDTVIAIATDLGLEVQETDLVREDLYCADEAFFTGTACEIKKISSVDGRAIENRSDRSVVDELWQHYQSVVRGDYKLTTVSTRPRPRSWCIRVYPNSLAAPEQSPIEVAVHSSN
jgi:branched-chain amino acid aminotransferase